MNKSEIKFAVDNFQKNLNKEFKHFMSNEYYSEIYKKWLEEIEKPTYPEEARPFMRLILTWKVVLKFIDSDNRDYSKDLVADCVSVTLKNMDYAVKNSYNSTDLYNDMLNFNYAFSRNFYSTMVERFPRESVERYVGYMIHINTDDYKIFEGTMCNLHTIVTTYKDNNESDNSSLFGELALRFYSKQTKKIPKLNAGNGMRWRDYIEVALLEDKKEREGITEAQQARIDELGVKLNDITAYRDHLYDPRRAELYDAAQRCQAQGDSQGCSGNMSALGDIGR